MLSQFQVALVERALAPLCAPHPDPAVAAEVRRGFRIEDYSVILFESRPDVHPPHDWHDRDLAKFTFVKSRDVWQLYCKFRDHKWHNYDPIPESTNFDALLTEVRNDPTGIFWG